MIDAVEYYKEQILRICILQIKFDTQLNVKWVAKIDIRRLLEI